MYILYPIPVPIPIINVGLTIANILPNTSIAEKPHPFVPLFHGDIPLSHGGILLFHGGIPHETTHHQTQIKKYLFRFFRLKLLKILY